jgi:hypothetical protein
MQSAKELPMKFFKVPVTEITKGEYYEFRNGTLLAERPLGYITEVDGERVMFIMLHDHFYRGTLMPWHRNDAFLRMRFTEIKVRTEAVFEHAKPVKPANAPATVS